METAEQVSENQEHDLNLELTDFCIKMDEGGFIELTVVCATFATVVADVNERNHNVAMAATAHRCIRYALVSARYNEMRRRKDPIS